jgi:hypothetical protein
MVILFGDVEVLFGAFDVRILHGWSNSLERE